MFEKNNRGTNAAYIKCLVRNKEIKLTPEEAVRQLYIYKLTREYAYPIGRIQLETPIHFGCQYLRRGL